MKFSVNNYRLRALRVLSGAFMLLASGVPLVASGEVKVACVGNSITYGLTLADPSTQSYPARLQTMLGTDYKVGNFGHSGATLLANGHNPYNKTDEYKASLDFVPDVAVIHLGINDTDPRNWPDYGDKFVQDYLELIRSYREVNPGMRILIARLTPITASHHRFLSGTRDWRLEAQKAIERVAKIAGVELIDFDAPLRDREDLIHDSLHPNAKGAEILASTVYGGITGDYGGLKMPEIYTDSMVIQRNRPLKIRGTANAGTPVTLKLDSHSYRTVADNRGRWSVITAPLVTGGPYEMTVSTPDETLTFQDILAGEVWLASGQSNMAFRLRESLDGGVAAAVSSDPLLRFYDKKWKYNTYSATWDSAAVAEVDNLEYYKQTEWHQASPATSSNMSAVGYYFGKMLRDSLDIPVGIICNAIGGSNTESWVDMLTLERDIPEITVDWLHNDYIQPWAQGRALLNMGGPDHLHPFHPGYLFSTGIRPLAGYPIAGAIWYQGESNAHNVEVHERLFESLVDSWRREFEMPEMPFYFVQLSSIERPSWPSFRESQRQLSHRIPNSAMAVSSDHGDRADVHPTNKRPVGERLARQALSRTYGHSLTPAGPEPIEARSEGGAMYVTFSNGKGMDTSTGGELLTFEVAETYGDFRPARAEILSDNVIKVFSMEITRPRYVRYGWQPYSTGNLVNEAGLPASTFVMEAGNIEMFEPEEGIEYGVSAAYAGTIGGKAVVAGGCNFPTLDPLAAGATKRFYKGVYTGTPVGNDFEWRLVGAMPEAKAYGAAVSIDEGIVLIGGNDATGAPLATVELLKLDPFSFTALPPLPEGVDNTAACLAGRRIYVGGGNFSGKPSNRFMVLDLDDTAKGWQELAPFPGNPRVQPVMAAAKNGKVYLWGGFAGKAEDRPATLDTEGLVYDPASGKWSEVAGPRDKEGNPVSLGGGAMTVLPDGRFAVIGGVNKDVFLEALRNQAPDYLLHPADWYRFNRVLYIFDPAKGRWKTGPSDAEMARAGASLIALPDGRLVVYGGELKPRIRSNQTTLVTIK